MVPEDTPLRAFCMMEGHNWGREGGGICLNCGEQLRCGECGQFVRLDGLDAHLHKDHPFPDGEAVA